MTTSDTTWTQAHVTLGVAGLVIDGGLSPQWMRNAARATAQLLDNARYLTLDDCDHGVPPERIAPVLCDFFGEES